MFLASYDWFTNFGRYHDLYHCMAYDKTWVVVTVALDLAVATGYALIALHWWRNQKTLTNLPAKRALGQMRNIFLFCGICGYLFIPVKMIWPAWRLYDLFMVVLVYNTWRYAWGAKDLKVIYQELARTTRLAEDLEASRAESKHKSDFLRAVSHDLRNPLYALSLQADVAELELAKGDPRAVREALAGIRSSAKLTTDLLNGFIELGRLDWAAEPNRVAPVSLGELAESLCGAFRSAAERSGLTLTVGPMPASTLRTDRGKLERVLTNLLSNAVKYTPAGGVSLEGEEVEGGVAIHVTDTGPGITAEQQAKLFSDFYQVGNDAHDPARGFGLGLAIARRLARQLGGDVSLRSDPGRGCRFTLSLPADAGAETDAPTVTENEASARAGAEALAG